MSDESQPLMNDVSSSEDSSIPPSAPEQPAAAPAALAPDAEDQSLPLVFTPVFKPVEQSGTNSNVIIPQTASYSGRARKKAASKRKSDSATKAAVQHDGATTDDDYISGDIVEGLARLDPLALRPRASSRVLCVIFGVLAIAAAFGVWWLGVCTMDGQSYDDIVFTSFNDVLPAFFAPVVALFTHSWLVQTISAILGVAALAIAAARRRWWLLGQLVVYALINAVIALLLKNALPRPFLINTESNTLNSAPSGHTILAAAAGVALLCAVPRAWRALAAVVAWAYAMLVGLSVIAGGWHRPTDVVMSLLLCGGVALLILAASRVSGMDPIGNRASSPSIQIVGSVMITAGVLGLLYAGYVVWQIQPGLQLSAEWTRQGAVISAMVAVAALASSTCGLVLTMRQLTASPLTKLGLVGAPPAPPKR